MSKDAAEESLVQFATRWWVPVYRISWNLLGNTAEAAAVTEETLLRELRSGTPGVLRRMSLYRLATWLALVLRDGEQLPVEEVATILNTSAPDVRARVHRARLVLAGRINLMAAARGALVPRALSGLPC